MNTLETFNEIAMTLENPYLDDWKKKGGSVVGYACIAFPREIAEAGNVLPFRLRGAGNADTSTADSYLSRYNCSVCRSCLELILKNKYEFLDGYIRVRGCDHWMGTFDEILHAKKPEFMHYFKVPHLVNKDTLSFFESEMRKLKEVLEKQFKVEIGEDDVVEQIKLQDKINKTLKKFYRKRFSSKPELNGSDAIAVIVSKDSLPSAVFYSLLLEAMKEKRDIDYRARVLLSGCPMDEIQLIREMERVGALIVSETTCFGAGSFWNMTEYDGGDAYEFLARKYLENLRVCARMFGEYEFRKNFVKRMAEEARVDGVILQHNKFCDLFGIENAKLRMDLEKEGIPVLVLEKEYASMADLGRIKTRIQAFIERLGK
jgi:benzoyl-CoA reductase/2-hydroxyglutaryl-CoA dehydratase subunit BcrC/BadD/HgdB